MTAKFTNPGGSSVDQPIAFKVTGANSKSGSNRTDNSGRASFTYTGTKAGKDTITACWDKDENHACDPEEVVRATATKTWTVPKSSVWEGWHTNPGSGCSARVQQPFLNPNQQVAAYTEVFCPEATRMTIRSRLRSDYAFRDITVAQKGCVNAGCVITEPKGYRFIPLACPKANTRRINQPYYTDIIIYPATNQSAATPFPQRSRPATLSPYCAY